MKLQVVKCPECHANLEIEEGRDFCYCQYCGYKILLDNEKQEVQISQNINITKDISKTKRYINDAEIIKAKNQEKENRRTWIALIFSMLLLIAIPLSMFLGPEIKEWNAKSTGKIQAGDMNNLIGEQYETVKAHFEAAGFVNIELIDLNDSGVMFWNDGKVKTISVGGNTSFGSSDWFDPYTKVVISYH